MEVVRTAHDSYSNSICLGRPYEHGCRSEAEHDFRFLASAQNICRIRSAIQAMLVQLYRLHFGNPEISPTGFTIGVFISIGYFP
jgi:hypothetical protein